MNAEALVSLNLILFFHLITFKCVFEAIKVDRFWQLLAIFKNSLTKISAGLQKTMNTR